MDTTPEMVLKHQLPDGITLVNILTTRLWFPQEASRQGSIEGITARKAMVVAEAPGHGVRTRLGELREVDVARLMHPRVVELD